MRPSRGVGASDVGIHRDTDKAVRQKFESSENRNKYTIIDIYLEGKRPQSFSADVRTILKWILQAVRVLGGFNEQPLVNS